MPCASQFLTEGSQLHWAALTAPVSLYFLAVETDPGWLGLLLFSSPSILPTLQGVIMWKQRLFPEVPLSSWLCGFRCSAVTSILPGTKHIIIKLIARG